MFLNPWYGQAVNSGHRIQDSCPDSCQESQNDSQNDSLRRISNLLQNGWTAHATQDGRIFYCNHTNQTSSWLPPAEDWNSLCDDATLPYGWEAAMEPDGKQYFINHLTKTTTYDNPRKDWPEDPPQPRKVLLTRDTQLGFGFVAGSEKPVIVRFVTEGGPSCGKLLPGDQVWFVNGQDVRQAPRDHVIHLVRSSRDLVQLTVCQPSLENGVRKSALLSAAKKAKLRSNPSRVRFAEGLAVNGIAANGSRDAENPTAVIPNVMKVYLENGQTKSFKYDSATTVRDVLNSLQQKLGFASMDCFSLCVEDVRNFHRRKLTLLDPDDTLASIAARPGAHNLRCVLRVTFYPKDLHDILRQDAEAFDYLFIQCCNDVVHEKFAPELKYDVALRLAALQMCQHALTNKMQGKISVKNIEKEYGLERFVPASLLESMKRKDLRKLLSHLMKFNGQLTCPGQKQVTPVQAKLQYLKIVVELPSYGAKCFSANIIDSEKDFVILISPKYGVSHFPDLRSSNPVPLCQVGDIASVSSRTTSDLRQILEIRLKDPQAEVLSFVLEDREAQELILVLRGYYKLLADRQLPIHKEKTSFIQDFAPPYQGPHIVESSAWSFVNPEGFGIEKKRVRFADFSQSPPYESLEQDLQTKSSDREDIRQPGMAQHASQSLDNNMNRIPEYSRTALSSLESSVTEPSADSGVFTSMENSDVQTEARNEAIIQRMASLSRTITQAEGSDSLLLLPDTATLFLDATELSSSETDTPNATPTHSPMQRVKQASGQLRPGNALKPSDSSFGLHSPDSFPKSLTTGMEVQEMMRRFQKESNLQFSGGTLYLDPDIIDLTMIPPPMTPDDENFRPLAIISEPPTPFADRDSLENELRSSQMFSQGRIGLGSTISSKMSRMEMKQNTKNMRNYEFGHICPSEVVDDLSGIDEDLSAFIIPPPPANSSSSSAQDVLQKLQVAREEISQVMKQSSAEKNCKINEDSCETRSSDSIGAYPVPVPGKTTPDLSPSSSHSSGYGSLKSIVDLNSTDFGSKQTNQGRGNEHRSTFRPPLSFGNFESYRVEDPDIPPPPPPPRSTRIAMINGKSGGMTSSQINDRPTCASLVKSSSQGDLVKEKSINDGLPKKTSVDRLKGKILSASTENLPANRSTSNGTNLSSKLSINSSNDSIGSNTSVATVKAAAGNSATPPLPPRSSPTRVVMKQSTALVQRFKQDSVANNQSAKPPPSLPSRLTKPSPTTTVPPRSPEKPKSSVREARPTTEENEYYSIPHTITPSLCNIIEVPGNPLKQVSPGGSPQKASVKSRLPRLQFGGTAPVGPLLTSSPKHGARTNATTVVQVPARSGEKGNGSLGSNSNEQDSLDDGVDPEKFLFSQAESAINRAVSKLVASGYNLEEKVSCSQQESQSARDELVAECRRFVTASKTFVKSVSESQQTVSQSLSQCVSSVERMAQAAQLLSHTEQGKDLVPKVRDVSRSFLHTVRAASEAYGKTISDPSMGRLMMKATALAGVLTTLMRSLRS